MKLLTKILTILTMVFAGALNAAAPKKAATTAKRSTPRKSSLSTLATATGGKYLSTTTTAYPCP